MGRKHVVVRNSPGAHCSARWAVLLMGAVIFWWGCGLDSYVEDRGALMVGMVIF